MKIAIVYPPAKETNLKGYPLGLAYLYAILKKSHEVEIYNYNGKEYKKSIQDFLKSIRERRPNLVGISFNSFNRGGAFALLRHIKKIDCSITVVLGGVHPSTLWEQIFKYYYHEVDFIIRSEGERSFFALCDCLERNADFAHISGLVYKDNQGNIQANVASEVVKDLDELPIPDFSFVAEEIAYKQLAYLITSRGCPVNCSFCSTSSFWGQKVRMNSPQRVGREVEYLRRLGARKIFFHDDTFNLGIDRTLKLCEVLKQLDVEYAISCRVKPINEEIIARLAESGCRHIYWGVETLSDKLLASINKKITKEEVKRAFDLCAPYADRMSTSAYCCVGLPGEDEGTVQETVQYLNQNIRSTHGPGASILYILPGTQVYRNLLKEGKFDEKIWIKSDAVYYYTNEHNIHTLNRWRKQINRSGIRLAYSGKYFWDNIPVGKEEQEVGMKRRIRKSRRKLQRFFNMLRGRY